MAVFEGVVPALSEALSKRGYTDLTPVQEAVLGCEPKEADMLVSAQTGSGKTVAFGLTLAPTLLEGASQFEHARQPLALAIAPTRELALQVQRELQWLYGETKATVVSCVGGMDTRTERRALDRGAHIVVGTPGRLRDHIERNALDLSALKAVVLDEADEMLDMGFRDDLEFILGATPNNRRTLMFSATVPRGIANLAKKYQRDAVRIVTSSDKEQHLDIDYRAFNVASYDRENAIINVLRYFEADTAIVFCATRATVNRMTSRFTNRGFSVVALSGELSQAQRTHALQSLRDGRARLCIATDVAARGLDLPNLELVIHADLPKNRESLLHRSGRTGRAGRKGVSALIVPNNARKRTERLFQNANIEATWANPPTVEAINSRDDERILDDPALTEPIKDDERAFAEGLLARHGAEQVAAAFVRLQRAGRSAPEELGDAPPPSFSDEPRGRRSRGERGERGPRQPRVKSVDQNRDGFTDSTWVSISVGRKHTAEPRWLLPMLCKAGDITNRDIGAIRIQENVTYVEFTAASAEKFLGALGPSRKLEKSMTVTKLKGMPEVLKEGATEAPKPDRQPRAKPQQRTAQQPTEEQPPTPRLRASTDTVTREDQDEDGDKPARPNYKKKADSNAKEKFRGKSRGKPWEKPGQKPKGKKKKLNKKARARLEAAKEKPRIKGTLSMSAAKPETGGAAPLKRKPRKSPA